MDHTYLNLEFFGKNKNGKWTIHMFMECFLRSIAAKKKQLSCSSNFIFLIKSVAEGDFLDEIVCCNFNASNCYMHGVIFLEILRIGC